MTTLPPALLDGAPSAGILEALLRASVDPVARRRPDTMALARAALDDRLRRFAEEYRGVDVGLVTCPPWSVISPHIGVGYLVAFLRSRGMRVHLFDLNIELYHALGDAHRELWEDLQNKNEVNSQEWYERVHSNPDSRAVVERHVDRIAAVRPRVLGFSIIYRNTWFANELARLVKAKDAGILTVAGGPEATTCYKGGELFRLREIMPDVDCFGINEGELPLLKLARARRRHVVEQFVASLQGDVDPKRVPPVEAARGIPGILVVDDMRTHEYAPAEIVEDIDEIPTPDYSDYDMSKYGGGIMPFLFSRGCILKCAFCLSYATFGRYRSKGAIKNFKEIKEIVDRYGIRNFEFNDLEVNGDLETIEDFCDLVVEDGLKIRWFGYFVARRDMTDRLFRKLKAAGCYRARFGGESGSDRVLKLMNKAVTARILGDNLRMSHDAGLETTMNIIVGFPGETEETFVETLDFVREHARYLHHIANVSMCTVVPNCDLSKNPDKYAIVPEEEGGDIQYRWKTADGSNTFDTRVDRMVRMLELCRDLDIYVDIANWEISDSETTPPRVQEMMRWYRKQNAMMGSMGTPISPSMAPHPDYA